MAILNLPDRTPGDLSPSTHSADHNDLHHVYNDMQTWSQFFPAADLELHEGIPTYGLIATKFYRWLLDPASTESVSVIMKPRHMNNTSASASGNPIPLKFTIHLATLGTGGNVRMELQYATPGASTLWQTAAGPVTITIGSGAADSLTVTTVAGATLFSPTPTLFRVRRLGLDAADTLVTDIALVGLDIQHA